MKKPKIVDIKDLVVGEIYLIHLYGFDTDIIIDGSDWVGFEPGTHADIYSRDCMCDCNKNVVVIYLGTEIGGRSSIRTKLYKFMSGNQMFFNSGQQLDYEQFDVRITKPEK